MNRSIVRVASALAASVLVVTASACSPTVTESPRSPMTTTAEKSGDGRLRTDLEPLTNRFGALGQPIGASWMSGELGSGRAPGPTSYWIDAIVELTPETAATLRGLATETAESADIVEGLASRVPEGTLTRSAALDAAFAEGEWRAQAWMVDGTDVVVLAAKGQ